MRHVAAEVGAEIVLRSLPERTISRLRQALRYPNPEYIKSKMAGEEEPGCPVYSTVVREYEDRVVVPRGCVGIVKRVLHVGGLKPVFKDRRAVGDHLGLECAEFFQPRPYQEDGASLLKRSQQGLVILPCGGGKTFLGLHTISKVQRSTLVIVPKRDLLHQWAEDVEKLFKIKPNLYGAGKHQVGPITIATADALIAHPELDLSRFGLVVYDEVHRVATALRKGLMRRIPARYRMGLTATPEREDGQTRVIEFIFGDKLLVKEIPELVKAGYLVLPKVKAVHTNFTTNISFSEDPSARSWKQYNRLTDAIAADGMRNELICDLVKSEKNLTWLILSPSRKKHAKHLAELLRDRTGLDVRCATSDVKGKKRKALMEGFQRGEFPVMTATSIADEGFNVRHLERVLLALPEGSRGQTTQRLGRLMRPEGQQPVVYDLVDVNVELLNRRWHKRKSVYRKLGMEIEKCPTIGLFK